MSTANKLTYLNGTKQAIKQAINEDFEVIDNNTTFREYADEISSNNAKYKDLIPKETKNATNTLDISNSSGLDKALVTQYGNTSQEGTPTPESPQDIHVVSGDNTIDVCRKNLFDKNSITPGYINKNGNVVFDGTNSTSDFILIPSGATNLVRTTLKNSAFYDKDKVFISREYLQSLPVPNNAKYIRIQVDNNNLNNEQLEVGSTPTEYEEYKSASYPINLGDIELCKIGDYKDRIYPLNGKWYLEKKIGKVVLDGSESWEDGGVNYVFYTTSITDYAISNNIPMSNYYSGVSNVSGASGMTLQPNNSVAFINKNGATTPRFYIKNERYDHTQPAQLKTWLSTHNTTVYYVLATPTTTEITENNYPTLYNQLNNIKLFEGVNHITMTNESGLDVEFDITYYKDWKLD